MESIKTNSNDVQSTDYTLGIETGNTLDIETGNTLDMETGNRQNTMYTLRHDCRGTFDNYFQSSIFKEMMSCVTFGLLLGLVPHAFLNVRERPIPYQMTAAGDVILDLTKDNKDDGQTVPAVTAIFFAGLIPFLIQVTLSCFFGQGDDAHFSVCVFSVGTGVTEFITNVLKNYVGYLRPNFYDLCGFDSETISCDNEHYDDARKSFPSGHSGLTFCTMTLLTLYLMRLFGVGGLFYRQNRSDGTQTITKPCALHRFNAVLCLVPMSIAFLVAASRVVDNYHHPADVVGGSVIGVSCALTIHRIWFDEISGIA